MRASLLAVLGLFVASALVFGEEVRLKNGDVVLGKVKSLDENTLILASENFGELKIARDRIGVIIFAREAAPVAPSAAPETTAKPGAASDVADDLAGQLKKLDPTYMKAIEQAFPLLNSSPEAKKYFTERVEGLMTGKINIEEVRQDAKKVVAELEDLKADLGEESGAALDGYLGILKRFLNETEPSGKKTAAPKVDPGQVELESPEQLQKKIKELESKLK